MPNKSNQSNLELNNISHVYPPKRDISTSVRTWTLLHILPSDVSLKSTLIRSSYPGLGLPSDLLRSGFPIQISSGSRFIWPEYTELTEEYDIGRNASVMSERCIGLNVGWAFHDFLPSLQTNAGMVPWSMPCFLSPQSFEVPRRRAPIYTIRRCITSATGTASLNNPRDIQAHIHRFNSTSFCFATVCILLKETDTITFHLGQKIKYTWSQLCIWIPSLRIWSRFVIFVVCPLPFFTPFTPLRIKVKLGEVRLG
jgi:hypothetical protein